MELKPGYKQTEAGLLPENWTLSKVGQEFEIRLGKMLDKDKNTGRMKPYLGNKAVQWDRVDISEVAEMAMSSDDLQKYRLEDGDLLVCEGGEVGRAAIWNAPLSECYFQKALHRLRPSKGFNTRLMLSYLRYWVDHDLLSNFVTQTSIAHLTKEKFADVPLPVPPAFEQRAIAAALSDVDALLAKLDQLIAKKRDLKQAAMQQLLTGQTRLPGFQGEWEAIRFGDVADQKIQWGFVGGPFGSNLKSSDYVSDGVRILQLQNIGDGQFHDDYSIFTTEEKADELLCNNIYPGEIILSKMGDPVARACFVPHGAKRYLMASDGIRLAVDERRFDKRFVHDYINSPYFRQRAIDASTGSTRQRIGITVLKALPFSAPPLPEQTAIADVLASLAAELTALEARRDKTRQLKQGMMQELLTGRIRLV